jgi:hypothetical protein
MAIRDGLGNEYPSEVARRLAYFEQHVSKAQPELPQYAPSVTITAVFRVVVMLGRVEAWRAEFSTAEEAEAFRRGAYEAVERHGRHTTS